MTTPEVTLAAHFLAAFDATASVMMQLCVAEAAVAAGTDAGFLNSERDARSSHRAGTGIVRWATARRTMTDLFIGAEESIEDRIDSDTDGSYHEHCPGNLDDRFQQGGFLLKSRTGILPKSSVEGRWREIRD